MWNSFETGYEIIHRIGEGTFGKVFEARKMISKGDRKELVLKVSKDEKIHKD